METTEKKVEACETFRPPIGGGLCEKCGWEKHAHTPYSERQAWAQVESIVEMVANLTREGAAKQFVADINREELIQLLTGADLTEGVAFDPDAVIDALRETVADYIADETIEPTGFEWDEDSARETIQEDALSVEYRSGWVTAGSNRGQLDPEEFQILLCTGGPAVRIRGEIDRGEPSRAWVEHQDWGTPWTQIFGLSDEQQEAILTYCREYIVL